MLATQIKIKNANYIFCNSKQYTTTSTTTTTKNNAWKSKCRFIIGISQTMLHNGIFESKCMFMTWRSICDMQACKRDHRNQNQNHWHSTADIMITCEIKITDMKTLLSMIKIWVNPDTMQLLLLLLQLRILQQVNHVQIECIVMIKRFDTGVFYTFTKHGWWRAVCNMNEHKWQQNQCISQTH